MTTGSPVYLISTKPYGGCDQSAENVYSSVAPDPNFTFVGGPCCLAFDFVFDIWIIITFYTLLTSLHKVHPAFRMVNTGQACGRAVIFNRVPTLCN
jgi:hypothetical protein